jgi:indole-3-glycerol phosphate synthase / phosphoribosylanthranilate isomerase
MDFLSEIIRAKRRRIESAKKRGDMERQLERSGKHRLIAALAGQTRPNIIAEFKRRSPSKGSINSESDPATMARIYEVAGAAAISVLTEEDYFGGSLEDLRQIRGAVRLPLLRKDFIVDEGQLYESAWAGADAVLLIVAAMDDQTLIRLRKVAEDELGMDALVEVHTKHELERAIGCGAHLIGVNNRNLRTFEVSVETSRELARAAPADVTLVSESGLKPADVEELRKAGYRGFLIGERFMRSDDPEGAIREFIGEPASLTPRVKICGITNLRDARAAVEAGADMLGFNFYPPSPRFIDPEAAREIIAAVRADGGPEPAGVIMLGVFVNESVENVIRIAERSGLDGIQLHGDETAEYFDELKQHSPQRFAVKVVRSNGTVDVPGLRAYAADAFMLDTYDPNLRGGTGRTADWTAAREAARRLPRLFLAGGLTPENVGAAISSVRPYAVDACSALELSPGKKDRARMREFVAAVRAVKLPDETIRA